MAEKGMGGVVVWIGGSPPASRRLRPKRVDYPGVQMQSMDSENGRWTGQCPKVPQTHPKTSPKWGEADLDPDPDPDPAFAPKQNMCGCKRPTLTPPSPFWQI
jgi:hypothetical protein